MLKTDFGYQSKDLMFSVIKVHQICLGFNSAIIIKVPYTKHRETQVSDQIPGSLKEVIVLYVTSSVAQVTSGDRKSLRSKRANRH